MEISKNLDSYEKQISAGKRAGLLGGIQIGAALNAINDGNLWIGVGVASFPKYVQAVHGFSRSSAYNLMGIAKTFGRYILADPALQAIEPTRLIRLLPFVQELDGQSNTEHLLHQAAHIPDVVGFDNQLRNMAGKTATDDAHTHSWQPINVEQCTVCGLRRKVKP